MTAIWSRQAKYERWMQVEIAVCEAHADDGLITPEEMAEIRAKAAFTLERCDEIEQETRHDLAAFVRNLEESIGPAGRWIHFGVTSYDIIDTALGMMLRDSGDVLLASAKTLHAEVMRLAEEHKGTPMIGRTHGIHAHASPEMEAKICARLGLSPEPISTQIINRDRHAHFLNVIALLGAGLERIATELRNLQRTEILEVQEAFAKGQTGSSAMPHKRNPWNSETVVGLSRMLRGHAHAMLESVTTWHERDLTNSSLERIVFPDACQLADFMLRRLTTILQGLVVFPENMHRNLRLMGDLVFSEHLMSTLIRKGMGRREAYKIAQSHAASSWEGKDFQTEVRSDPAVRAILSEEELAEVFSLEHHLRHADHNVPG